MKRSLRAMAVVLALVSSTLAVRVQPAEALESTDTVYAVTATNKLLRFAYGTPATTTTVGTVSGLQGGESIVGIDFRPRDGKLYAVGSTSRLYTLDTATAAASVVDTLDVALSGTAFGVDFNNAADALRITSDTAQNLRHPFATGTTVADTATTPNGVIAVGYTNPVAGAQTTSIFGIDHLQETLVTSGAPNGGVYTNVGSAFGFDVGAQTSLDVTSDGQFIAAVTLEGGTSTQIYNMNGTTGAPGSSLGTIGGGEVITGLAVSLPTQAKAFALTQDDQLITLGGTGVGRVASTVGISGLVGGEDILGIDVRPANGRIYGFSNLGFLYVIDPITGHAAKINKVAFTPLPTGISFAFDFNPVVDRIRLIGSGGQNLVLNPDTGQVQAVQTNVPSDIVAAAYSNNTFGAASTVLFATNYATDTLGTINVSTGAFTAVGATGVDLPSTNGFDIGPDGTALAVSNFGGDSKLYSVNVSTGAYSYEGQLPANLDDITLPQEYPGTGGYYTATLGGEVRAFGGAVNAGDLEAIDVTPNAPIVDIEASPGGNSYWLASLDGGVFNFGNRAGFYGSAGNIELNAGVVGIAAHPSAKGYWLVAEDGGVFNYGAAGFFGSAGSLSLNAPIVGIAPTVTGLGYWLFAEDGGVFAYGDAVFHGSAGSLKLNAPVVGGGAAPDGRGYYLVAEDGGIFNYGPGTTFSGSLGNLKLNEPIFNMAVDPDGRGYYLVALDGGVFTFDAVFAGSSANDTTVEFSTVGIAAF